IAILFSFALVLILFAGLTQNNYAKELAESQGVQKNLVEVTAQYQTLSDSMKVLNKELESAQATIEMYEKDIAAKANQILVTDTLIKAMELYDNGNVDQAKEKIANISADGLTDTQLYMYNRINK
ncbi:MAG: hypothetical protein IJ365_00665, partial [Clostridia bacterium]|nr:hypothetical protein [Clostridia bacterium]